MVVDLEQHPDVIQLLDKLINDVIENCAMQCDEIEAEWRAKAEKHNIAADHGRRDGAMWCAAAVRELKW